MKTKTSENQTLLLFTTGVLLSVLAARAEPTHELTGIAVNPDHTVVLTAEGSVTTTNVFRNYFDLVPVQASADFTHWATIATMLRTNLATNSVSFSDPLPVATAFQFYRTASNQGHTPLRKPTGPFAVGTTTRLVTDPYRTN